MSSPFDSNPLFAYTSQGLLRAPILAYHGHSAVRGHRRGRASNTINNLTAGSGTGSGAKDDTHAFSLRDCYARGPPKCPSYLQSSIYALLVDEQYRLYCAKHDKPRTSPSGRESLQQITLDAYSALSFDSPWTERLEQQDLRLPSAWSSANRGAGLVLQEDHLGVEFQGNDHDEDSPTAAAIRSNHSIKPQCGLFYYEVEVLSDGMSDGHIGVGFCWNISRTDRLPGVDGYSWGYHGENGHIYSSSLSQGGQMFGRPTSSNNNNSGVSGRSGVGASQRDSGSLPGRSLSSSSSSSSSSSNTSNNSNNNARPTSSGGRGGGRGVDWAASERSLLYDDSLHVYNGSSSHLYFAVGPSQHRAYGPTFGTGDIVGCGLDFRNNSIFFTRNGVALGTAFCQIRGRRFHPMVGFKHPGDGITTNFGQKPFAFNIEQYRKDEMNRTLQHILLNDSKHDDTNYTYDQPNAGHRNDHHRLFRRPRQNTQKQRKNPPIESPSQQEKAVLDDLVLNYLHHAGYTGTYLALKKQTVDLGANAANNHTTDDVKESLDYALLRHEICQDVRNGLIDQVFQKCEQHYSGMLDRHARLCFRLRCQKFITCVQQMDSRKNKQAEGRQLHQPRPQDAMVASMAIASPVSSASLSVSPMSIDASSSSATAASTKRKREGAAFESDDDDDDNARVAQRPRRAALPSATEKSTDNNKERGATRAEHEFNDVSSVMELEAVMEYGQFLQETYGPKTALVTEKLTDIDVKDELTASFSTLAYTNASDNPNLYLTEAAWRQVIANDLNDAILCEQGEPGTSSIERLYQQTSVATRELVMLGDGEASMIPKLEHIL